MIFGEREASRNIPARSETSNKSDHGRLLILAGREGFWGAGILASAAAFRMGAGYVQWASFTPPLAALKEVPEVLTAAIDDNLWESKFSAACIGPGLGTGGDTAAAIEKLKTRKGLQVVVDADAITACVDHGLFPLPEQWIVTPHAGELARVLKITADEIGTDRERAARMAVGKTGCYVLLKGHGTLVAGPKRVLKIDSGNAALAKAGTGDVLTGMIGSLYAQGLGTEQGAATAAYIHGRLADEWVKAGNDRASLMASDLKAGLPQVLNQIRNCK